MNNFVQRAITGLSFAFIMSAAILYSSWSFVAVFFLIATFGLIEFYGLMKKSGSEPQIVLGVFTGQVIFLLLVYILWNKLNYGLMVITIPLTALIFIMELFRKKTTPFHNIALTLTGIAYIILPVALMSIVAFSFNSENEHAYHGEIIMGCIFLVWASDTGAYMIGSKFGKHPLFERISPKKSWEGFFGGMVTAMVVSYFISLLFTDLLFIEWMIISVIIVVTGTLGDLVESMLKRSINVKDSGTILPGHGGILDRFDALLISIPFVFFYLLLIDKIGNTVFSLFRI